MSSPSTWLRNARIRRSIALSAVVLDTSGSMSGEKIEGRAAAKAATEKDLGNLSRSVY